MTNVIFSFDTEDIINERGAEGIIRCARILREEGIRGCFNIIGLLPNVLKKWKRDDIFEELKYHEIDFHSNRHSIHPTINEYTDEKCFEKALDAFLTDESIGIEAVKQAFLRDRLPAACIPGNCTSYVAHYGYSKLGFKIFSGDDIYDKIKYRPVYNCNVASLHYARSLDGVLFRLSTEEIANFIEETARGKHTMVYYHHPQRAYCKSFWDADNFNGKNTPCDEWIKSEIHNFEDTERFYDNFRTFVRTLRDDKDFSIITYADLEKILNKDTRIITKNELYEIRAQLNERFFPVTMPNSCCIADILLACRTLLLGESEHICSEVYGFLDEPYVATEEITISRTNAIAIARRIKPDTFLPSVFYVNGKPIGPRDLLDALLAFLLDESEAYTVTPSKDWQIDLDQFPALRDLSYKGSWIHTSALEDNYLSHRLRLQSWTIRLPKGSDRFIFN